MYICKYCGKECKNPNSLRNHERLCKLNLNRQESSFVKYNKLKTDGIISVWNKGLTKETDIRVKKQSDTAKENFRTGKTKSVWLGRKHSEESKKKMSDKAKFNHDNGIGHTWMHRWGEPSYAEKWLYKVLDTNDIVYEKEKPFFGFFLDVAIGNKCIEIDGEQHYNIDKFPEIHNSDIRKDKLLFDNGWKELRIRWKDVINNEQEYIKRIINFIKS